MSGQVELSKASQERVEELLESLVGVRERVQAAYSSTTPFENSRQRQPTLLAVSKYKPASDILACFESGGQLDFGENYVQELVDKAQVLPGEIRWHFIGTLQSNKAKTLASIPNLYAIHSLTSIKAATALSKSIPPERKNSLRVLVQINTSGEDSKSGLHPLLKTEIEDTNADTELTQLAKHIISQCPHLRLEGLMTIGAIDQSHQAAESGENLDFERLKETRDVLQERLIKEFGNSDVKRWGSEEDGVLRLSMGMSSDFEAAIKAGADIVRVGSSIFGQRPPKTKK
ncbi:proline synthetase associated protein [Amanita muscaria]